MLDVEAFVTQISHAGSRAEKQKNCAIEQNAQVFAHYVVGFSLRGLDFAEEHTVPGCLRKSSTRARVRTPAVYRLTSSHSFVTSCRVLDSDTTLCVGSQL